MKPIAGTESCEFPHFMYVVSGRMRVLMYDGNEVELRPGDVASIAPGHDASSAWSAVQCGAVDRLCGEPESPPTPIGPGMSAFRDTFDHRVTRWDFRASSDRLRCMPMGFRCRLAALEEGRRLQYCCCTSTRLSRAIT